MTRPVPYPVEPQLDVFTVAEYVIDYLNANECLNAALERYDGAASDNVYVRWLSRKQAYEVKLYLDAETLAARYPRDTK